MAQESEKRIILTITSDAAKHSKLAEIIRKHIDNATHYTAWDGADGLLKIERDPPHVVITDLTLAKLDASKLVKTIFANRRVFKRVAIIILANPPQEAAHLDEIVSHRLQFIKSENEPDFAKCLLRALTFAFHKKKAEYHLRFVRAGELLIREGDQADFVFLVKKGKLRAFRRVQGKEVELGTIAAGEFAGEMAYVNGEPRSADVATITDCELIEIPIGTIEQVLYRRPAWSKALLVSLSKRLKIANNIKTAKATAKARA